MLLVTILESDKGLKITAKGHTGYADAGKDIVCAAASAIMQTAVMGLENADKKSVIYKEKDGFLEIRLTTPEEYEKKVRYDAILTTMLIGLKDLENGYKAYVKVEDTRL